MKRITLPALGLVVFLVTRPTPSFALVGPNVGDACTLAGSTTPASPNAGGENLVCTSGLWAAVAAGAAGSTGYVQFNTGGALTGDSNFFWDNTNKFLEIGTATPTSPLEVDSTVTNLSGIGYWASLANLNVVPAANGDAGWHNASGGYVTIPVANTHNLTSGTVMAADMEAFNKSAATISDLEGSFGWAENDAGTISGDLIGGDFEADVEAGTVANEYGIYTWNGNNGGTVTNRYGVYIDTPTGTATNDYGFYEAGTQQNYFAGDVGIGTASPASPLQVIGGVTVSSTCHPGWQSSSLNIDYCASSGGARLQALTTSDAVTNLELNPNGGHVGIGTASPAEALDVTGNIAIGGNIVLNVNNTTSLVAGTSGAVSESGTYNTMVGYQAGTSNTTGAGNTLIGTNAGYYQTTANYNAFLGVDSGWYVTTGSGNTALGAYAMNGVSGSPLTGNYNVAVGESALYGITTTAADNTAVGYEAGYSQTTATSNTATGYQAGYSLTTGTNNTLNGVQAGYYISTGNNNTAVGVGAIFGVSGSELTGNANTAVGQFALKVITTTASDNTAVGYAAGEYQTTATNNTLNGFSAGSAITTGSNNTAIGFDAGSAGTAITTGANDTFVGYQAQANSATYTNGTALGNAAILTASNSIVLGNSSITAIYGQVTSITAISDRRHKKDIAPLDSDLGLDFIDKLKPVSYRFKNGDDTERYGFIAQDMEQALPKSLDDLVETSKPEHGIALLSRQNNKERTYRVAYGELTAPIVKSIQQQQAEIEASNDNLLHKISAVKADNDNLEHTVKAMKADNDDLRALIAAQGREIEELKAGMSKIGH